MHHTHGHTKARIWQINRQRSGTVAINLLLDSHLPMCALLFHVAVNKDEEYQCRRDTHLTLYPFFYFLFNYKIVFIPISRYKYVSQSFKYSDVTIST